MLTILHDLIAWAPVGIPAFIFVISVVVFFHELGHFLMARACGVAIEAFSIGFGGEIVGWTDSKKTRWKICWLPLGGYVKFAGDENAASIPSPERLAEMSEEEKKGAFPLKPLWQRILVVAAGPIANFILAFVVFAFLFAVFGARTISTYVGVVEKPSAAYEAGIRPGDKITAVDGKKVELFNPDLILAIRDSKSATLAVTVQRGDKTLNLKVSPREKEVPDIFGGKHKARAIGVEPDQQSPENMVYLPVPLEKVPLVAAYQCWGIVDLSLTYVWRIVAQKADTSQLGGPVRIAKVAKSAASTGFYSLIYLIAVISVSIGLINLFPIPLLDGGHLLYYACEGVLGRPLSERVQGVGFRIGLALVLGLMIFATWNDLVR
ncbi:regulator of sigma E protease [Rhizomicrobium palustre]|uniref:Zinc metalloprotease n=1 Tax=Rhizomicrobium palustre TaxID=189966 RepID=A0A846N2R9_9PROT|nr:RIP metalloprotease RseP [Rhizomicrobium palustre]NIK89591.1 regulator of sigma E protease [Rhizomicrobium palustre]